MSYWQVITDLKKGTQIAVLHRQTYLNSIHAVLWKKDLYESLFLNLITA